MGSFRSQPDLNKGTHRGNHNNFEYAVSHVCGWRLYMEDADIVNLSIANGKCSLFAIFDGHGGAEVSTYVSRKFVNELEKNQDFKAQRYEAALRSTFFEMDRMIASPNGKKEITQIQKELRDKKNAPAYEEESHAGCTANVVLITSDRIYCANAGDSRSVCKHKSNAFELSKDHKPEDERELKRITKAGGVVNYGRVNGGLNLSRALGDLEYKKNTSLGPEEQMISAEPDVVSVPLNEVEYIVMGCDGIWEVKTSPEMIDWFGSRFDKKELGSIIQELFDNLISKDNSCQYGMDNMSCIVIRFNHRK